MKRWWIAEPGVLGTSNPTSQDIESLADEGFSLVVSLLDESEQRPGYERALVDSLGLERVNIPVRDFQPPDVDQLVQFVRSLEEADPKRVVVHCLGGSGRTGTFAAAYWIARGMTAREAVLHIRKAKPTAIETREQLDVLSEFETRLRTGRLEVADESEVLPTGAEIRAARREAQRGPRL